PISIRRFAAPPVPPPRAWMPPHPWAPGFRSARRAVWTGIREGSWRDDRQAWDGVGAGRSGSKVAYSGGIRHAKKGYVRFASMYPPQQSPPRAAPRAHCVNVRARMASLLAQSRSGATSTDLAWRVLA